jgi:hypothetical protein
MAYAIYNRYAKNIPALNKHRLILDSLVLTVLLTNNYVMQKLRLQKAGLYSHPGKTHILAQKQKPTPPS